MPSDEAFDGVEHRVEGSRRLHERLTVVGEWERDQPAAGHPAAHSTEEQAVVHALARGGIGKRHRLILIGGAQRIKPLGGMKDRPAFMAFNELTPPHVANGINLVQRHCSQNSSRGVDGLRVRLLEPASKPEDRKEEPERHQEEQDSALVVQLPGEKRRVDMDGEQRQGDDSDGVLDQRDWQDHEHQRESPPRASEKRAPGQKTREQQRNARSNTAALVGDFDHELRQREYESLTEVGSPGQREQASHQFRRADLQETRCGVDRYRPASAP